MEKCYDPRDSSLTFVDGNDDLDFLYEGFKSKRAKMSCGHAVTPTSLTNWCRRQLDEGKSTFQCGVCNREWSYLEVRKMALLTPKEMEDFEKAIGVNAIRESKSKWCPGCSTSVLRENESDLSVVCTMCTAKKGRKYEFCWQCMREWIGPHLADRCGNDGCCNESLMLLKTCPEIIFTDVKDVTGCPSVRACPTCGVLIEHNKTQCKNLTCLQCNVEFCFVCLKLTKECLKSSSYYKPCSSGVADRQTAIPEVSNSVSSWATSLFWFLPRGRLF